MRIYECCDACEVKFEKNVSSDLYTSGSVRILVLNKLLGSVLAVSLAGCSGLEMGVSTGYGRFNDQEITPFSVRIGKDVNEYIGLDENHGNLHLSVEAFDYEFHGDERGSMRGATPMGRYEYPFGNVSVYAEAGAGPGYLDMRTREQGHAGFNFLDQGGFGARIQDDGVFLQLGYRYMHISHGGTRDSPNRGIDSHLFLFGFGFRF